jgi:hypothetical protein
MRPKGRPEGEYWSAQREGGPVSAPGRNAADPALRGPDAWRGRRHAVTPSIEQEEAAR